LGCLLFESILVHWSCSPIAVASCLVSVGLDAPLSFLEHVIDVVAFALRSVAARHSLLILS
jgi:hypothetical protein